MRTRTAVAKTETGHDTQSEAVAAARQSKPAPAPAKKGGLSFGNIAVKKTSGKSEYPTLPDEIGAAGNIARLCRSIREEITTLEGDKKREDADLHTLVFQWYWQHYHGKMDIPSSVYVNIPAVEADPEKGIEAQEAARILVTIPDHYKAISAENLEAAKDKIIGVIGQENYDKCFRDAFVIKIDGDKIQSDSQQEFINELSELCQKYNCLDALEAKPTVKAVEDLKKLRQQLFTVEQNALLNQVYPIIPKIITKNVE